MFPPGTSPSQIIPSNIHFVISDSGGPKTYLPRITIINVMMNGHSIKSQRPFRFLLTLIFLNRIAMYPMKNPTTRAPRNPVPNGSPLTDVFRNVPSFISHPPKKAGANVILPAIE